MKKIISVLTLTALIASGCAMKPPASNVHQPMSVRPTSVASQQVSRNGSIFPAQVASSQGNYRPLFEDYRARNIGDTMTIVLNERTAASSNGKSNANRESEISASISALNKIPGSNALNNLNIAGNSSNTFSGGGDTSANNAFSGNITVTVIEVLPNGNLLVSGEKVISINHGDEFIRFSGIVNPQQISASNTITSTQVADARVEYKSRGYVSESQVMGWLARFFLTVLPL